MARERREMKRRSKLTGTFSGGPWLGDMNYSSDIPDPSMMGAPIVPVPVADSADYARFGDRVAYRIDC